MLMTKAQADKVQSSLNELLDNDNSFYAAWKKVSETIKAVMGQEVENYVVESLDEVWEAFLASSQRQEMRIEPIVFGAKHGEFAGRKGLQLISKDSEGEMSMVQQTPYRVLGVEQYAVPAEFVAKIRELAYLGYDLRQSKTWEEKEV